jgi:hypothetical protein
LYTENTERPVCVSRAVPSDGARNLLASGRGEIPEHSVGAACRERDPSNGGIEKEPRWAPFAFVRITSGATKLSAAVGILAREGNLEGVILAVPTSLFGPNKGRVLTVGLLGLAATLLFAAPANAERPGWYANPSLSGEARVGATLSVNQGGIKCDNCLGTALEWSACTGPGNAGADRPTGGLPFDGNPAPGCQVRVPFPGTPTYTPGPNDAGLHIQAHIVADNNDCGERRSDGSQECRMSRGHAYTQTIGPIAGSPAPTAPVAAPQQPAAALPLFTAAPAITGTPVLGQTLTATPGTVTGTAPIAYSYQWLRCSTALRGCQAIQGATGTTYTVERADVGARITVTVTASNRAGGRAATARLTTHVRAAAGAGTTGPTRPAGGVVRVADLAPAERLTVDNVAAPRTIRPAGSAVLRVRVASPRGLVAGAGVEVFGRPGEVASATARKTGANGVAVIRVRAAALPAGREIVLVVVASKPNDDSPAVKLVRLRVQT